MKKNKKTVRHKLLEARFADLAVERKSAIVVPESLAQDVFQTLERTEVADAAEELTPPVQDKVVGLFEDER
ncbi:MAG: hypothetical protein ACJATN_000669 [Neolewinella sp.]|jgi:hypothetical protein